MSHNCPLCSKKFSNLDEFDNHIESHKNESVLNKPARSSLNFEPQKNVNDINFGNLFGKEIFEKIASEKLNTIKDLEELIHRRNFVEQMKKTLSKHPFLYLPYFLDDFFSGNDSKQLIQKYFISYHMDLKNIVQNILNFKDKRYRLRQHPDAFKLNMKIPTWKEKYNVLKNNFDFFKDELLWMFFYNMLRSYVILLMIDYNKSGISKDVIINESKTLKNNFDIFHYVDEKLQKSLEKYFDKNFEETTERIILELLSIGILTRKSGNPKLLVGKLTIDKLKENIINELKFNPDGQNEGTLKININTEYPSLNLLPGQGLWKTALTELKNEKIIRIESRSNWRDSGIVFLNEDYDRIQKKLQRLNHTPFEFYGRTISPDDFIEELKELEKGDFGDQDDQVTRIAGLVLAESVKLQSPHEDISEFDFITNISNYKFRDDQIKIIQKLNFQILYDVFHCKVMLNQVLTMDKYTSLRDILPKNEQGIVITFEKIPDDVKRILETDKSIQIIDEEGLKLWASVSSVIPSRKNSLAKLHFDPVTKLKKKLVKINLIDYESGLATVSILPTMSESIVLVRSLEEIPLNEPTPNNFETYTNNYFEFLKILFKLTTNSNLIEGIFDKKILDSKIRSHNNIELVFENHQTGLSLTSYSKNQIVNCNCLKWVENKFYLCPHLVSSLDHAFRTFSTFNEMWTQNDSEMNRALEILVKANTSKILERLGLEYSYGEIKGDQRIVDFVAGISKIKENS